MATKTTTANLSLGHLGIGKEIQNLDLDNSEEAGALRRFHDIALRLTLRDYPWGFTKTYIALSLIETFSDTDPNQEWAFSYQYPADCLKIRKLFSGIRNDTFQSRVRYQLGHSDNGQIILSDLSKAVLVYSKDVTDYGLFPDDFIMAHSLRWALYVPNRLLAADPFKLKNDLLVKFRLEIANAKRNNLVEQEFDQPVESEFMRSRI